MGGMPKLVRAFALFAVLLVAPAAAQRGSG